MSHIQTPVATSFARRPSILGALVALVLVFSSQQLQAAPNLFEVIEQVQPKMVKIYGAGGFRGLEPYQSGFLVSAEGHILTVWSYVLDTDYITVTLNNGRRFEAKLLGADPTLELAVLKIDAADLPHFTMSEATVAEPGSMVLAFSNLYKVAYGSEDVSVQHGYVAVKSRLEARRGVYETPYSGEAYIIDAMTNNPGAAGGALVDRSGNLLGMLGKELRNAKTNTWLNYSIPIAQLEQTAIEIIEGKFIQRDPADDPSKIKPENAMALELLGIVLVPDVLDRTPPFVDSVRPGSPAAAVGIQPDDLVLFINNQRLIQSCKALKEELGYIDRDDPVRITVMRDQELQEFELRAQ